MISWSQPADTRSSPIACKVGALGMRGKRLMTSKDRREELGGGSNYQPRTVCVTKEKYKKVDRFEINCPHLISEIEEYLKNTSPDGIDRITSAMLKHFDPDASMTLLTTLFNEISLLSGKHQSLFPSTNPIWTPAILSPTDQYH